MRFEDLEHVARAREFAMDVEKQQLRGERLALDRGQLIGQAHDASQTR